MPVGSSLRISSSVVGFELADFVERGGARENGREDLLLANAPGDELRVLAAEIENDYAATFRTGSLLLASHFHSPGCVSVHQTPPSTLNSLTINENVL